VFNEENRKKRFISISGALPEVDEIVESTIKLMCDVLFV